MIRSPAGPTELKGATTAGCNVGLELQTQSACGLAWSAAQPAVQQPMQGDVLLCKANLLHDAAQALMQCRKTCRVVR